MTPGAPLAEAERLVKWYAARRRWVSGASAPVRALDGVDLAVRRGECLALVGESGAGKTTLGRCLIRLLEPTSGRIRFDGEDLLTLSPGELRRRRRRFQMVFQDADAALDPRQRAGDVLAEALALNEPRGDGALRAARAGHGDRVRRLRRVGRGDRIGRIGELLAAVRLPAAVASRFPHELSGGQRQRLGIARALAVEPELVIADEPVAALDASVRAQILNLLADLRRDMGLTLLLIAHDLAAVEQMADRVAVLYLGRLVELARRDDLFARPLHPYTACLLAAVPEGVPRAPGGRAERLVLSGDPPSPISPPGGCPFHPRCPIARARCAAERPPLAALAAPASVAAATAPASDGPAADAGIGGAGRLVACFYPGELQPPPRVSFDG